MVSSLTNLGILMQINIALGGGASYFGKYNVLAFAGLIVLSFFTTLYFQKYMAELTNNIMYSLELSIIEKVRNASYESFEKMGGSRLYAAVSDARVLGRVPEIFVAILNAAVTLICSLGYLYWISLWAGITITLLMVGLLLVYLYRNNIIEKDLNKVRDLQDNYYNSLRELLVGFKQIRVSTLRNLNIFNKFIFTNRNKAKELSMGVSRKYIVNELIGVYSWYFVLGVIIFLLPVLFHISLIQLAVFITTILFMMSPVSQLIVYIPSLTGIRIALERINRLDGELKVDALPAIIAPPPFRDFTSLRFENVSYMYSPDEKRSFELHLPDFRISKGEIIFVVGGNGSGKTTFINVLTALCRVDTGKVWLDEQELSWEEMSLFSNSMAVVYSDHYLFTENYDEHDLSDENELLQERIEIFNLNGILSKEAKTGNFSTKLSKGQQKRLALMLALTEDKPIIVLDEWAAEQDPENRRLFYLEWLPMLKRMGKTIIAISHDDDFFHVADRVIRFNYGKIVSDTELVL
ncbi:cyclic peptide export ABC transporter [Chitinophaga oryziterrae]